MAIVQEYLKCWLFSAIKNVHFICAALLNKLNTYQVEKWSRWLIFIWLIFSLQLKNSFLWCDQVRTVTYLILLSLDYLLTCCEHLRITWTLKHSYVNFIDNVEFRKGTNTSVISMIHLMLMNFMNIRLSWKPTKLL